eukprot:Platyproteum_vivax@DN2703_c0_g1_i1.p1
MRNFSSTNWSFWQQTNSQPSITPTNFSICHEDGFEVICVGDQIRLAETIVKEGDGQSPNLFEGECNEPDGEENDQLSPPATYIPSSFEETPVAARSYVDPSLMVPNPNVSLKRRLQAIAAETVQRRGNICNNHRGHSKNHAKNHKMVKCGGRKR